MSSGQWATDQPWNVDGSCVECSILGFPARSPTQFYTVIQVNTAETGPSSGDCYLPEIWNPVDVSHWVPEGTKMLRLDGILILSHPLPTDIAEVLIAFRKHGETYDYYDAMQVIDQHGGGQRSGSGTWVPLDEQRRFDFKWKRAGSGAHGFNLRMTAYAR